MAVESTQIEQAAMKDFWQVYESRHDQISEEIRRIAEDLPEFAATIRSLSPENVAESDRRNRELQRGAILNGEWEPYLTNLETQGARYAQMGISFPAWFDLVSSFRKLLIPYLYSAYGKNPDRFISAANSMDEFIDRALAAICKAYLNKKEALVKERTQELEEAEARYRTLVEQSLVGVYLVVGDRLAYANEAMAQIFGYDGAELLQIQLMNLVHPDDRDLVERNIEVRLRGDVEMLRYEFRGLRRDGSTIHCEVFGRRFLHRGQPSILGTLLDITDRKQSDERIQRQLQHVAALHKIDLAIASSLDLRLTLNIFLDQVTTTLRAHAASVLLFNRHTHTLEWAAGRGFHTRAIEHSRLRLGEGLAGRAALERRIIQAPQLSDDHNFTRASLLRDERFMSYYGAPLVAKGEIVGVLDIFHRTPLSVDPEWLDFLDTLAGQAAIAIDSGRLFEDLQRSHAELTLAYDTTLEGWSKALDLRDKETEGHTLRVTDLALHLARTMGMKDEDLVHLRRGALLHDIGKMGVPDAILLKPGPLTEEEWRIMRGHTVQVHDLLSPIPYLRPALDIPYAHHEKWDGTGYPRGLKGEQIPLAARIFAVIDVWDALTSDRPYRKAWPKEKARHHIREQAGAHFDPRVVEAFLALK